MNTITKVASNRYIVSIILPIFNSGKYLHRCLDSIVMAAERVEYKHIQLILIDDGSTDNSHTIAASYCTKHPWMQLISQQNQGPSSARNNGLKNATGNYIGFIDSDDTVVTTYFSHLLEYCKEQPDVIVFGYKKIYLNGKSTIHKPKALNHNNQAKDLFCQVNTDRELFWYPHTKWFRREIIKNLRFNEAMKLGEDTVYNLQAVFKANRIIRVPLVLYAYYETKDSLSSNTYKPNLLENMELHFNSRLTINQQLPKRLTKAAWTDTYDYYVFHILPWLFNNSMHLDKQEQLSELKKIRYSTFVTTCYSKQHNLGSRPGQIITQSLFRAKQYRALQLYL